MPELRKDPITGTWVIISEERKKRPKYYQIVVDKDLSIPEELPLLSRQRSPDPARNLRPAPRSFAAERPGMGTARGAQQVPGPARRGGAAQERRRVYDKMNGIGAHEVIIETPRHRHTWFDGDPTVIRNTLLAARARILDLEKDSRFKYIMVFKNFGPTAGATLSHSHSQLIALPVVPLRVQEEIDGARAHFQRKERCIFCDIIQYESEADRRLLVENEHFTVLAPYAPRFSFELAVYPKRHNPAFESTPDNELESLSAILSETLGKVARLLNRPDYNFIIHNAPCQQQRRRFLPLAHRVHAGAGARGRLRMGHRLLHQPRLARGVGPVPEVGLNGFSALPDILPRQPSLLGFASICLGDSDVEPGESDRVVLLVTAQDLHQLSFNFSSNSSEHPNYGENRFSYQSPVIWRMSSSPFSAIASSRAALPRI